LRGVARTGGKAGARIFVPAAPPCIATDQFVAKQYSRPPLPVEASFVSLQPADLCEEFHDAPAGGGLFP